MELRGIGIINARRLFGIGAVKMTEKIDLVVELEQWNPEKIYDRMGVDTEYVSLSFTRTLLPLPSTAYFILFFLIYFRSSEAASAEFISINARHAPPNLKAKRFMTGWAWIQNM